MELIETEKLIPSRYIREELSKNGFQLSDDNKATMIWNDEQLSYAEKLSELQKLCDSTDDEILKQQLRQRIDFENKKLERLKDNSSGLYIYVFDDHHNIYHNYFLSYEIAMLFVQEYLSRGDFVCAIHKKKLISSCDEFTKTVRLHLHPYTTDEPGKPITVFSFGESVSEIRFDKKGNIAYLHCDEMSEEEEYDTYQYRKDRFEQNYFAMPLKFSRGTIVRDITDNSLGVIAHNADFSNSDVSDKIYINSFGVMVLFLGKYGTWQHKHIRPIYLDKAEPLICDTDDKKDRAYIKAINSFSNCLKAGLSEEEPACLNAIADACEYRDICLEYSAEFEKQIYNDVDTAVRLEDIMN